MAYTDSVANIGYNDISPMWTTCRILMAMALITRTATIQLRVVPRIKQASEQVLWKLGLNMSEAVELFLRRVIVDQCIPFQVVALEIEGVEFPAEMAPTGESIARAEQYDRASSIKSNSSGVSGTGAKRKVFKKFLGAHTSTQIQGQKGLKKRVKRSH